MSYVDTFIQVAPDCPVASSVTPVARGDKKPVHLIQYELLSANPYTYTHEELLFEVHVRHKGFTADEVATRGAAIREELFRKSHPCLRACMLPKKFGWGIHFDTEGRIALVPMESERYQSFLQAGSEGPTLLYAMRNKRA